MLVSKFGSECSGILMSLGVILVRAVGGRPPVLPIPVKRINITSRTPSKEGLLLRDAVLRLQYLKIKKR
jgi:hypothetical protein